MASAWGRETPRSVSAFVLALLHYEELLFSISTTNLFILWFIFQLLNMAYILRVYEY